MSMLIQWWRAQHVPVVPSLILMLMLALAAPVGVRPVAAQSACPPDAPPHTCALPHGGVPPGGTPLARPTGEAPSGEGADAVAASDLTTASLGVPADVDITDLGILGGSSSWATGINDAGQVVGYSTTASFDYHAFVWTASGGMRDLGTLGGAWSEATSINDAGHVTGYSYTASVDYHAFMWTPGGSMRDLGTLGGADSLATGINDAGQVVGYSTTAGGSANHATLWTVRRTVVAADRFARTITNGWGSAETGGAYHISGAASAYAVNGSVGTMTLAKGLSGAAFLPSTTARDVDVRVRVATNKLAAGAGQVASLAVRTVSAGTEYRAQLRLNPNRTVQLRAARAVGNVETQLGSIVSVPGVTHTANTFIWVRVQASGVNPTTVRIKAWAHGQAEPTTWLLTVTDSQTALQTAGTVGLRAFVPSAITNSPVRFSFDDFRVTRP